MVRPAAFDAGALDRAFRLVATDVQALLLGPPLLAKLRALAPRADWCSRRSSPMCASASRPATSTSRSRSPITPLPPGAHSEPLADDPLALVARRGERPPGARWTLAEYAARDHATVAIFGDRVSEIDAELAEAGLVRRVAFTSPHFLVALAAVARAIA